MTGIYHISNPLYRRLQLRATVIVSRVPTFCLVYVAVGSRSHEFVLLKMLLSILISLFVLHLTVDWLYSCLVCSTSDNPLK